MTIINANKIPLGQTVLCATTLWSLDNKNQVTTYNRVINQVIAPEVGNQLGAVSYNLEAVYRPVPKSLNELASAADFSALLLYVGQPNHTIFGYRGSNQTGDGDIALFYDVNQKFIKAEFAPAPTKGTDNRFHFKSSFTIDNNVHFILFGGRFGAFNIEEIVLK